MCQAYEGEKNFIVAGEHMNELKGFAAARRGEPKESNPHRKFGEHDYNRIAWDHGWDCWHERIFPFPLELKLKSLHPEYRLNPDRIWKIREEFENEGKLPEELEKESEQYS